MTAGLRKAWASRTPRERAVLVALGVVLLAALLISLVQAAAQARARLRPSVTALQAQLARLERHAAEIERLRASPPVVVSPSDLRALVQSQIGAGLSQALVRIDAPEPGRVQVVFGAVPFPDWLAWIDGLKAQQVRVETSRIEALSSPGVVSVTATLVRSSSP
jgi:type II secretory pathway component PulM